jgi:hypothetical protein
MKTSTLKRLESLETKADPIEYPRLVFVIVPCGQYDKDDPKYSAKDEEDWRIYQETGRTTHLRRIVMQGSPDGSGECYTLEPGEPYREKEDEDEEPAHA